MMREVSFETSPNVNKHDPSQNKKSSDYGQRTLLILTSLRKRTLLYSPCAKYEKILSLVLTDK